MTRPLQRTALLPAMARMAKAGLKILAVSIYACLTASVFSGIILFIVALIFGGADAAGGGLLSGFFGISFVMGLPVFLVVGVPVLHLIPRLKHAHPRYAALAGAISAAIVDCCLYWLGNSPELTHSSWATLFFGSTIVWAAFAGGLYQYTRKLP
ncbi:hypothetical protein NYR97_07875 [Xanthomonas hydrangeae]|uniref:Uncharacterized protein n=1 Tax=Xanthomonas hydrangeae TaxID=2775159 RepID=A0AAU0BFM9_9XANT|nr:hypothetical protein [Xanthomonas hydrangeae]WOB51883.1 hypothetical protein NYR97_07875 [Xanthomonas hydrangeae]